MTRQLILESVKRKRLDLEVLKRVYDVYASYLESSRKASADDQEDLRTVLSARLRFLLNDGVVIEYKITCDDSNNPPGVVAKGIPHVHIAWKTRFHTDETHSYIELGKEEL